MTTLKAPRPGQSDLARLGPDRRDAAGQPKAPLGLGATQAGSGAIPSTLEPVAPA